MFLLSSIWLQLGQVLKIVGWVSLPLVLIAILITVFLHYRRKRKKAEMDDPEMLLALPSNTEVLSNANGPGAALARMSDSYGLLQYGRQLEESKTKYELLKADFERLKSDYEHLLAGKLENAGEKAVQFMDDLQIKIKDYEKKIARLEQALEQAGKEAGTESELHWPEILAEKDAELARLRDQFEKLNKEYSLKQQLQESQQAEIVRLDHMLKEMQASAQLASSQNRTDETDWREKMDEVCRKHFDEIAHYEDQSRELQESFRKLQEENLSLQEQLLAWKNEPGLNIQWQEKQERTSSLQELLEEKNNLLDELAGLRADKEISIEKDRQISFVQEQLDQKIRNYHQLEAAHGQLLKQGEHWRNVEEESRILKSALQQHEADKIQLIQNLEQKQQEWEEATNANKQYRQELEKGKQENTNLQQNICRLEEELIAEQERGRYLQQKLQEHIRNSVQLYRSLAGLPIGEEGENLVVEPEWQHASSL